jgi:translation initiation factor 2B subunit (eIF-2B alpha/beta/delta family)
MTAFLVPNSPSIPTSSVGSSSKSKARKRLMDVFKYTPNSPGPLIISSPLRKSMGVDNFPETPIRASKPILLSSSPVKGSPSPTKGPMDLDSVPSTPSRTPRRIAIPLVIDNSPEYDAHLESVVDGIRTDYTSNDRQIASFALSNLATLIDFAADTARVRQELWEMTVSASKEMAYAKPAASAAVTACLLRALLEINAVWDEEMGKSVTVKTPKELSGLAGWAVERLLEERKLAGKRLGKAITFWVKAYGPGVSADLYSVPMSLSRSQSPRADKTSDNPSKNVIRVLTLGNSASVHTAIQLMLKDLRNAHVHLTVLDSRPRFDGADLATNLLDWVGEIDAESRLHICVVPDCAVASVVKSIDILLLSADRISANGDVCSRMGSLVASICTKELQPKSKVVVIADGDKIVSPNALEMPTECHSIDSITKSWSRWTKESMEQVKDKVEIFVDSQEWVPKNLIDAYVTDSGLMDAEQVASFAEDMGTLESALFG